MAASENGHSAVCELLLNRGANIDMADKVWNVLYYVILCHYALEMIVNIMIQTDGKNALICASEKGHIEVCYLLLSRGADIDIDNVVSVFLHHCLIYMTINIKFNIKERKRTFAWS